MPAISVCMPTYNGAAYLREAIDSVLNQSFTDFELIITDDCSKDDTLDIVESYDDPRIRACRNDKNKGLVGNWNECLAKAQGRYIQFFFQDDIMARDSLKRKFEMMEQDDSIALCFSASCIVDSNDKVTMRRRPYKKTQIFDGKDFALKSFRSHNLYGEPSNVMLKHAVMQEVGSFNPKLSYTPDWEYWIRMSLHGNVGYIDEELSYFRVADTSTTSKLFAEKDGVLAQDDRDFIESLRRQPEWTLTDMDVRAHIRSNKMRNFAKRIYFATRRSK